MENRNSEIYSMMTNRFTNSSVIKDTIAGITYVQNILELLAQIEKADPELYKKYITNPASTRFHGINEGDLFNHSFNVCFCLLEWMHQHKNAGLTIEDCIKVGMLHDLCKAELYYKDENGKYKYDKTKGNHHALLSVKLIKKLGIKLNLKQKVLILLHMSSWHNNEDVKALHLLGRLWLISTKNIKLLQAVNWADMKAVQDELVGELTKKLKEKEQQ